MACVRPRRRGGSCSSRQRRNPATVEWTVIRAAAEPDLTRAPRQRDLFETLKERGGSSTTSALLSETGASRNSLRELVRRGAVRLVRRQEPAPLLPTIGDAGVPERLAPFSRTARRAVKSGGPFLWRTTGREEHGRGRGHSEGHAGGWETGPGTCAGGRGRSSGWWISCVRYSRRDTP